MLIAEEQSNSKSLQERLGAFSTSTVGWGEKQGLSQAAWGSVLAFLPAHKSGPLSEPVFSSLKGASR